MSKQIHTRLGHPLGRRSLWILVFILLLLLLLSAFGCASMSPGPDQPEGMTDSPAQESVIVGKKVEKTSSCPPHTEQKPAAMIGVKKELGKDGQVKPFSHYECGRPYDDKD